MDFNSILASIKQWNGEREPKDASLIKSYFAKGNSFLFKAKQIFEGEDDYLHVYIGVLDSRIKLFVLCSEYDNEQSYRNGTMQSNITVCDLIMSNVKDSEITKADALLRIEDWKVEHNKWIDSQLKSTDNIFQAFAIPALDIETTDQMRIFFALKEEPTIVEDFIADLVIFDQVGKYKLELLERYMDLVRPVPPFKPAAGLGKEKFFLLGLATR